MADIIKREVGEISVAFASMRCTYMLPCVLPEFHRMHPNVKVNVYEGNSEENDRRLLDGQVEVAFYSKPSELNSQILYETLAQEELLICTCRDHPLRRFARPNPRQPLSEAGPLAAEKRTDHHDAPPAAHPADHGRHPARGGGQL